MTEYVTVNKEIRHEEIIAAMAAAGLAVYSIDRHGVGFRSLSAAERVTAEGVVAAYVHDGATELQLAQAPDVPKLTQELEAAGVTVLAVEFEHSYPGKVVVHHAPGDSAKAAAAVAAHDPTLTTQERADRAKAKKVRDLDAKALYDALVKRDPGLETELGL